jgi:FKBP-type peptidyl-prolyl cis-trans isomerase FkpA
MQQMKTWVTIFFSVLIFSSCKDNNGCMSVKPEAEESAMVAFATSNGMNVTKHSSGLHYQIMNQGSGVTPNASSKIWVTYIGKHLDGTVFYQTTNPVVFEQLGGLIEGWKIGLQLIQKGGHIKLIIPSALAYGCSGSANIIAPNEILYYEVQLIDVQ